MIHLLVGLAGVLLAANAPAPPPGETSQTPRSPAVSAQSSDAVEREYEQLLEADDAAQQEVDNWIREANAFQARGAGFSRETLNARIEQRFAPVKKAYVDFLRRHPKHVAARIAYGSFLNDIHEEEEAVVQWEKARELDPTNPAPWNNLANHFGHHGPLGRAFEYYEKAIELRPDEPVYYQNLATTLYLFRKDAMERYKIKENQVFDRALELYRKALKLDPNNFTLATDYAQTYYGIKPLREEAAVQAWNYALKIANDQFEREGVHVHLARIAIQSGRFDKAREHLNQVTNSFYDVLKSRLTRNIAEKEKSQK